MHKDGAMNGAELQDLAIRRARALPGAELTHPFGFGWEVFKVRGKVFMLLTSVAGEPIVILKSAPADGLALREEHDDIRPGYHMNKQHWITLAPGGTIERSLVDDLVVESFLLVVEKLPRNRRPVDPDEFGKGEHSASLMGTERSATRGS